MGTSSAPDTAGAPHRASLEHPTAGDLGKSENRSRPRTKEICEGLLADRQSLFLFRKFDRCRLLRHGALQKMLVTPLEIVFGFSNFSAVRKGGPLTEVNMTLTPSELLMWGALFSPVLAVAALFLNDDGGHPA